MQNIVDDNSFELEPKNGPTTEEALLNLYIILETYMGLHANLSINHLSKKCAVNEPTLRRIRNRQLKRLPSTTNILKLLSHISKKNKISDVIDFFPGALIDFISQSMTQVMENDVSDVTDLTNQLKHPTEYLIYKLSANESGVTKEKVLQLFGMLGEQQLEQLVAKDIVSYENGAFHAKYRKFCLAPEVFKKNFKATADFIKPENLTNSPYKSSQMFFNMSSSVNIKAYSKILKIQRSCIGKIRDVLFDKDSKGDIPTFVIGAIDTLDNKSAFEISKEAKRK